jgi:hypothetical protein
MSSSELARWVSERGFPTTKADVENDRRPSAKLVEHIVVENGAVDRFVAPVQARFPMPAGPAGNIRRERWADWARLPL